MITRAHNVAECLECDFFSSRKAMTGLISIPVCGAEAFSNVQTILIHHIVFLTFETSISIEFHQVTFHGCVNGGSQCFSL